MEEGFFVNVFPKQPYFVMEVAKYYKTVLLKYGISHFYSFRVGKQGKHNMLAIPDGCTDILFCCDEKHPVANICGTVLAPWLTFSQQPGYYFGVRFLPGVMPVFCHFPMAEVLSKEVPFQDAVKGHTLFEKITESQNFQEQQRIFLEAYLHSGPAHGNGSQSQTLREYLVRQIVLHAGTLSVKKLAEETGYTERYIERVFKEYYGMTPKLFCKLMRFQYLLDHLKIGVEKVNFAGLTQLTGYYDQSHMIREFKRFTRVTPTDYLHALQQARYDDRLRIVPFRLYLHQESSEKI